MNSNSAPTEQTPVPSPPQLPVEHWYPTQVGLLGVIFTPLWAGAIAALNGHRLGHDLLWRPIAIGASATLLCFCLPWIMAVIVYLGALGLIWKLDLRPQLESGSTSRASFSTANFLIPCLVGVPFAMSVFACFFVFPFFGSSNSANIGHSSRRPPQVSQSASHLDISDLLRHNREREQQQRNSRYTIWGTVLAAKTLGTAGGKAVILLLLATAAGVFKWLTRKPTNPTVPG